MLKIFFYVSMVTGRSCFYIKSNHKQNVKLYILFTNTVKMLPVLLCKAIKFKGFSG